MTFTTLTCDIADGVALVTFRRGDQLNAMNTVMMAEMTACFEGLSEDAAVRVIVVTGDGRAFQAGADIKEYAAQTEAQFAEFQSNGNRMYASVEHNAKPVIAAVNGYALGGGFEFVLCCDIVIAAETAKLGLPEIRIGLIPGGGGTIRTTLKLGRNMANFLMMTGQALPAAAFVGPGLVNEVVAPDAVVPRAMEIARVIAGEPPAAIEGLKRLTGIAAAGDVAGGLKAEQEVITELNRSDIAKERVAAFAAKSAAREKT